jgi:hypothetical protein
MSIKIERKCGRCGRENPVEVETAADAVAAEELAARREKVARDVREYLAGIPREEIPDVIAFVKGEGVIHTNICDLADAKRSCTKRMRDLLREVETFEERKPREKREQARA